MTPNPYESPQAVNSPARPVWVRFILWKVPTRRAAMAYVWFSIILTLICAVAGYWYSRAWVGLVVIISAPIYWVAIRWMDQQHAWGEDGNKKQDEP